MSATSGVIELNEERTIVLSRVFNAPRDLVFDAWTKAEHIAEWWGPSSFRNTRCDIDLRVGGVFNLFMRGPDGAVHACKGHFSEIVRPERLVYEGEAEEGHPCGAGLPPYSHTTVRFEDVGGNTKLTIETRFRGAPDRKSAHEARFSTSWLEALERLADHLRH